MNSPAPAAGSCIEPTPEGWPAVGFAPERANQAVVIFSFPNDIAVLAFQVGTDRGKGGVRIGRNHIAGEVRHTTNGYSIIGADGEFGCCENHVRPVNHSQIGNRGRWINRIVGKIGTEFGSIASEKESVTVTRSGAALALTSVGALVSWLTVEVAAALLVCSMPRARGYEPQRSRHCQLQQRPAACKRDRSRPECSCRFAAIDNRFGPLKRLWRSRR